MEAPRTTDAGTGQDAFLAQAHGGGASPTSRSPCWHAAWNGSGCLIYSTLHRAPLSAAHAHPCWEPGVRKDERMAPASRGGTGSRGSETRPRCTRSRPPTGCCRSRAASPRSAGAMAPCRLSQSRGANLGIAGTIHCEFAVRRGGIYEKVQTYTVGCWPVQKPNRRGLRTRNGLRELGGQEVRRQRARAGASSAREHSSVNLYKHRGRSLC